MIMRPLPIPLLALGLLAQLIGHLQLFAQENPDRASPRPGERDGFRMPRSCGFRENLGQWDEQCRFLARQGNVATWLDQRGLWLVKERPRPDGRVDGVAVRLAFVGSAGDAHPQGRHSLPGVANYFVGEQKRWRRGARRFSEILYSELYPGIDLVVREQARQLEYDLLVRSGASLGTVAVRVEGAERIGLRGDDLVIDTSLGPIRQTPPLAWYREADGARLPVSCRFVDLGGSSFGFTVTPALSNADLLIDPGLNWGTYLGGTSYDFCVGVGATASGHVIVAGETRSVDFPTRAGAYSRTNQGRDDAFAALLSPDGRTLLFATYLGGSLNDNPWAIGVSPNGETTLAGTTYSPDWPTTPGAFDQTPPRSARKCFVARLDATLSSLVYSTFLGVDGNVHLFDLALHPDGSIVAVGQVGAGPWPTTPGAYKPVNDINDGFVTRLNATGTGLIASTLIGGQGQLSSHDVARAVAIDAAGVVTVAGHTTPVQGMFPTTPGAFDTTFNGGYSDAFVARFDPAMSRLVYSTFLGGSSSDVPSDIALSPTGSVVVVGGGSDDFPTTPGAMRPAANTLCCNGFITRLNPSGSALEFSAVLRADMYWTGLDASDAVYIAGIGGSGLPTTPGARNRTYAGGRVGDGFVATVDAKGSRLIYSSFLGGSGADWVRGAALLPSGDLLVVGYTESLDFPVTQGAHQTAHNGLTDGFVVSESMLPLGTSRYGKSTPSCRGPLTIDVSRMPEAGALDFAITCAGAMPSFPGIILVSVRPDRAGTPLLGATIHVALPAFLSALTTTNSAGGAEVNLPIPPGTKGLRVFAQFVFPNARSCGITTLGASNALDITVQ